MCALCAKSRHHSNLKKKKNSCIKIYIKKKGIDEKLEPSSKRRKTLVLIFFLKKARMKTWNHLTQEVQGK
jgi:hypothetical protein